MPLLRVRARLPVTLLLPGATLVAGACREDLGPPVPPQLSVDAGPDIRSAPGVPAALIFRINDPRGPHGPWGYRISWGDGTVNSDVAGVSGRLLDARHTYAAPGD